jgi:signal transduction histidine kinase
VYENLISNALRYNRPGLHLTLNAEVIEGKTRKQGKILQPKSTIQDASYSGGFLRNPAPQNPKSEIRWVRCTVSDNGVGMTQQQCDRAFDLYTRGPNKRQSLSLGLGLYMCRQIITAHGGEIGVISNPGNGATFWFTLPIQ